MVDGPTRTAPEEIAWGKMGVLSSPVGYLDIGGRAHPVYRRRVL